MAKPRYPSDKQDQFMLRFPDGLRDRIKSSAEKHGRSMNAEIIRVLENEFPEPWPIETRLEDLLALLTALQKLEGEALVDRLGIELLATVEGIVTGRVTGVDDEARLRVKEVLEDFYQAQAEDSDTRTNEDEVLSSFPAGDLDDEVEKP